MDISNAVRLGKKHAIRDSRTVKATDYLCEPNESIPLRCDWFDSAKLLELPMYENDRIGNCTVASFAHLLLTQTTNADGPKNRFKPSEAKVLRTYSAISGYDPKTGENDEGAIMLDCLKFYREIGLDSRRIGAFGEVRLGDIEELFSCIHAFGGVYAGFSLPLALLEYGTEYWGCPSIPSQLVGDWAPGSWGGHAVYIGGYDSMAGTVSLGSWGSIFQASLDFVRFYMDECYVLVSEAWTNDVGLAPSGLDIRALVADVNRVSRSKL